METGLHENHHRTYDPKLGRYTQPDPLGLAAGKNPFNYVNQNPFNATDTMGLDIEVLYFHGNFRKSNLPHIALRDTDTDMFFEINPVDRMFIKSENVFGLPIGLSIGYRLRDPVKNRKEFLEYYKEGSKVDAMFESVTFRASPEAGVKIRNYFASLLMRDPSGELAPTGIYGFWGRGETCGTGVKTYFQLAGFPEIGISSLPGDIFRSVLHNPQYVNVSRKPLQRVNP